VVKHIAACYSVLLCVAVCCCVLLCVAACCGVLQCAEKYSMMGLQRVAACCSVSQHAAACCSVLLRVAVRCCVWQRAAACCSVRGRYSMMVSQCVAVCCCVMLCGAVWCSVVWCLAMRVRIPFMALCLRARDVRTDVCGGGSAVAQVGRQIGPEECSHRGCEGGSACRIRGRVEAINHDVDFFWGQQIII